MSTNLVGIRIFATSIKEETIMFKDLDCPVDFVTVNENKVRVTALYVFFLALIFLLTEHWLVPLLLLSDFYVRGFNDGKYSLLGRVSEWTCKAFKIKEKPIDRAPKRFAAQLGFLFCDFMFIASVIEWHSVAFGLGVLVSVFAFLESFFGFCAGCYLFKFLQIFSKKTCLNIGWHNM